MFQLDVERLSLLLLLLLLQIVVILLEMAASEEFIQMLICEGLFLAECH